MLHSHSDHEKGKCNEADDPFAPLLAHRGPGPFVIAQLGQSLDGRIATPTGDSRWINRDAALDHLHRLRAHVDAVVVGVGTVIADNPQLNVRRVEGQHPARVVIDPAGRLPAGMACMASCATRRLVVRSAAGPAPGAGVEEVLVPAGPHGMAPRAILDALVARGLSRILVEGGANTISRFMDAGCVDRLHVLVAPLIIGSGKTGLDLAPIDKLTGAMRPKTSVTVFSDGDVLFDCDLRTAA